jgi:hypothetical protein
MHKNNLFEIIESYKKVTHFILIKFDDFNLDTKEIILRNFIAKSHSLLNSISILVKANQIDESKALYRLLIERYFYLEYLEEKKMYQEFKDWSFIKTYEIRNKMRSHSQFNNADVKAELKDNEFQIKKYQELKDKKNQWVEPKIENFAKEIDLSFLYSLGYDLGSSHIHPRADEGLWDALRIVKNETASETVVTNLLSNSILISNSILALATFHSKNFYGIFLQNYCNTIYKILSRETPFQNLKHLELMIYSELMPDEK